MAVDSAIKRRSVAGWPPAPDGTIDDQDRRQVAGWYQGIAPYSTGADVESTTPYLITPEELQAIFQETDGVLIEFGSTSTYGHFEDEDLGILPGEGSFEVTSEGKRIVFATGYLTGLTIGSSVTVAGLTYTVRDVRQGPDGAETIAWLAGTDDVPEYGLIDGALLEGLFQETGGVAVVFGGTTTYGHYRDPDIGMLGAAAGFEVIGTDLTIVVAYGRLSGLQIGSTVTVDGDTYLVRDLRRIKDGAELEIDLGNG